ncbi:MAG: two-CW domain-containing protein [Candidatus Thorarchaeota archaeon]|jgi:hypothetical protein
MTKQNCWEFKNCGRELGGTKVEDLGVCPAASDNIVNGINSGTNGGRLCWALVGTLCGGEIQGEYARKMNNCIKCDFYHLVSNDETNFVMYPDSKERVNCWQFKSCGREPSGEKAEELGVCPAAVESKTEGVNRGQKGGRICWAIAGTLCGGKVQGEFATKVANCVTCDFYNKVFNEEPEFVMYPETG